MYMCKNLSTYSSRSSQKGFATTITAKWLTVSIFSTREIIATVFWDIFLTLSVSYPELNIVLVTSIPLTLLRNWFIAITKNLSKQQHNPGKNTKALAWSKLNLSGWKKKARFRHEQNYLFINFPNSIRWQACNSEPFVFARGLKNKKKSEPFQWRGVEKVLVSISLLSDIRINLASDQN